MSSDEYEDIILNIASYPQNFDIVKFHAYYELITDNILT